jgi:hypothetical protein
MTGLRAHLAYAVLLHVEVEELWPALFWRLLLWAGPLIERDVARTEGPDRLAEVRAVLAELQRAGAR